MPSAGSHIGPLVTKAILPPKPTTAFRNSVRELEPRDLTLMVPTAVQLDTSDVFLVSRMFSEPGTGARGTTQEVSPRAKATGTTTTRVCSMSYLKIDETGVVKVALLMSMHVASEWPSAYSLCPRGFTSHRSQPLLRLSDIVGLSFNLHIDLTRRLRKIPEQSRIQPAL